MTTDPDLADRALRAGRDGTEPPEGYGELEKRVIASFYAAGQRQRQLAEPEALDEWRRREGRIVEDCKRKLYGTPGPEQRLDLPHDPGEPGS